VQNVFRKYGDDSWGWIILDHFVDVDKMV
jgi:hypothetical protein